MSGTRTNEAKPKGPYHHGDLAGAALRVALSTLQVESFDALSMRKIAGTLGVTHGALYRHYKGNDALLEAIVTHGYRQLAADVADFAGGPEPFCRAYVRFALGNGPLYNLMMERLPVDRSLDLESSIREQIQIAVTTIGSDLEVKRKWAILHGGITLHRMGTLMKRDDEAAEDFLVQLAGY